MKTTGKVRALRGALVISRDAQRFISAAQLIGFKLVSEDALGVTMRGDRGTLMFAVVASVHPSNIFTLTFADKTGTICLIDEGRLTYEPEVDDMEAFERQRRQVEAKNKRDIDDYHKEKTEREETEKGERMRARKAEGRCILCGKLLNPFLRLFRRESHPGCKEFKSWGIPDF